MTDWVAIFTGGLFVVGIGQLYIFNRQAGIFDQQAGIMRNQLATTEILERAHIVVDAVGVDPFTVDPGCVGHYLVRNVGHVPATDVQWVITHKFSNDGEKKDFPVEWVAARGHWSVAPGIDMRRSLEFQMTGDEFTCFTQHKWVLYIFGEVRYFDGFHKEKRVTYFCHRYGLGRKVVAALMENKLRAERMRFHQYGNGTDENPPSA